VGLSVADGCGEVMESGDCNSPEMWVELPRRAGPRWRQALQFGCRFAEAEAGAGGDSLPDEQMIAVRNLASVGMLALISGREGY